VMSTQLKKGREEGLKEGLDSESDALRLPRSLIENAQPR